MTFAIDFNDEFELGAVEVYDEVVDGTLAQDTIFLGAEVVLPELMFGEGRALAQFFGAIDEVAVVGKVDAPHSGFALTHETGGCGFPIALGDFDSSYLDFLAHATTLPLLSWDGYREVDCLR